MVDLRRRTSTFEQKVDNIAEKVEHRLKAVETGANQIVLFGIYLLAITIIAGSFFGGLSVISSKDLSDKVENLYKIIPKDWTQTIPIAAVIISAAWIFHTILKFISDVISRRHK
jgi:hypothetical protein